MAMPKQVAAPKEEEGAPSASDSHDTQEEAAEEPTEDADGASSNKMEFSCNEDAKDYLAEKYGVVKSKLLTRKAIEDAAKENGIDIVWTK